MMSGHFSFRPAFKTKQMIAFLYSGNSFEYDSTEF